MDWDYYDFEEFVNTNECDGCVVCYTGFHPHMLGGDNYAFCKTDEENRILEIKITELEDFNYNDILKVALKSLYKKEPRGNRVKELFGVLIGDLIQNGIVPVANKSTAKKALQNHYLNMLDTNDDNSLIAKWFKGNFDALYPHLVQSLHKLFNISEK